MKTSLFVALLIGLTTPAMAWDLGKVGKFSFKKIAAPLYVMHGPLGEPSKANQGFMNNPGFILSKNGIILVDPGSSYRVGTKVLEEVRKISKLPILAVFNTHIHGDHWLANHAIKEAYPDAKIYGHPGMITKANGSEGLEWISLMEGMTEGASKGTKIVAPTIEAKKNASIEVDGQHFKVHYDPTDKAHTDTDIMIEHVEGKVLFLGDNCFVNRFGRYEDSGDMHGNIEALKLAASLKLDSYVPGHGPSGPAEKVVTPFLNYLEMMKKEVAAGYAADKSASAIKKSSIAKFAAYKDWAGFDANFGKHIIKMYTEEEELSF